MKPWYLKPPQSTLTVTKKTSILVLSYLQPSSK